MSTIGYREAATLTRQKRAEKLFSALSRTSSTISLLDVKTEEPPFLDTEEKQTEDNIVSGKSSSSSSSSRLLFGRPPIKKLLRRSTRTALKESISYRVKKTLNREYLLVGRESDSAAEKRRHPVYLKYFVLFLGLLLLLARTSETVLSVYASFQTSQAGVQPIYS